jgi:hypothetical protein
MCRSRFLSWSERERERRRSHRSQYDRLRSDQANCMNGHISTCPRHRTSSYRTPRTFAPQRAVVQPLLIAYIPMVFVNILLHRRGDPFRIASRHPSSDNAPFALIRHYIITRNLVFTAYGREPDTFHFGLSFPDISQLLRVVCAPSISFF